MNLFFDTLIFKQLIDWYANATYYISNKNHYSEIVYMSVCSIITYILFEIKIILKKILQDFLNFLMFGYPDSIPDSPMSGNYSWHSSGDHRESQCLNFSRLYERQALSPRVLFFQSSNKIFRKAIGQFKNISH